MVLTAISRCSSLTMPLGIGIVTTAQKKGIVREEHLEMAVKTMLGLNVLGSVFGKLPYVSAMTDVTGFGLLGHLTEVCEGSNLSAEIEFDKVPRFDFLQSYIQQKSTPEVQPGTGTATDQRSEACPTNRKQSSPILRRVADYS